MLQHAAQEVGALSTPPSDARDPAALDRFFSDLPGAIDHVLVTAPVRATRGKPNRTPLTRFAPFARPGRAN